MYALIKTLAKKLIPNRLLIRYEEIFRSLFFIFYLGKNRSCNICNHTFSSFINTSAGELICPSCGSISRNRRLWQLLTEKREIYGRILDFSPSRVLYRKLKKTPGIEYISTDFENEFLADKKYDITSIPEPQCSFDLILCYHILEHIEEDQKAMSELFRILKPEGKCYIQTPFKEGDIFEDSKIKLPEERLSHFGQEDHVRIYSASGLEERLKKAGFKTEILHFNSEPENFYGLKEKEQVIMAVKPV